MAMTTDKVMNDVSNVFQRMAEEDSEIGQTLRRMFPRETKWRYWSRHGFNWHFKGRGRRMFAYSTERLVNGKFASWVWLCTEANRLEKRQVTYHVKRKDASARARRLMQAYGCPCSNPRCGKSHAS